MSDLAFRSARSLSAAIRRRDVSSRELLDLYLSRIEQLNPSLNAVVTLDVDGARRAADAADAALARGEVRGPLHGVPMTIKDTYETAGMRTTCGFSPWSDYHPDDDAASVRRLRDAGAVDLRQDEHPDAGGRLADAQSDLRHHQQPLGSGTHHRRVVRAAPPRPSRPG